MKTSISTAARVLPFLAIFSSLLMYACSSNPYKKTNKLHDKYVKSYVKILEDRDIPDSLGINYAADWVGATNFGIRKPNIVVIHHTAQKSCEQTLETFTTQRTKVSSHYVICENGTVHHMLNDYFRAQHAGIGKWGTINDVNSSSVGIEIDNDGHEPFTEAQMQSLEKVLEHLKTKYNIPTANFIGHSDLAPTRKVDPSVFFDWQRISEKGFGIWYDDTSALEVPVGFNPIVGLKVLGYDVKDTAAVISTFKRKYLDIDQSTVLDEGDKKVLYSLFLKSL